MSWTPHNMDLTLSLSDDIRYG